MKVLSKLPGEPWKETDIPNELKALQDFVGGYIETVTVTADMVIICNEEGRIHGLPYCCSLLGEDFVGPVILAGVDGEEFTDCPQREFLVKLLK